MMMSCFCSCTSRVVFCCYLLLLLAAIITTTTTTHGFSASPSLGVTPWRRAFSSSSSSTDLHMSSSSSTSKPTSSTPLPKYPVQRGESIDSRQIVKSARQHLQAISLRHVLFATELLATTNLYELRGATMQFSDLALSISACEMTRDKGGTIGWVNVKHDEENEHLNGILPETARKQVVMMNTKPGDVVMVESERGFHLVQIADVMVDVRKLATSKPRRVKKEGNYAEEQSNNSNETKRQLTYSMETMGCQMNQADSERMEGQLQSMGMIPLQQDNINTTETSSQRRKRLATMAQPDVVVLNTCSIRDHAEQKVYSHIGPHAKRKRDGDDVTIIVAGCVAQQEAEALLTRAPEVDLVIGPQYANRLSDLVEHVRELGHSQLVATDAAHIMEDATKPRRSSTVAAWVNVIYGCNERCTFCIVPTTRGVEQSRPVESIVTEVKELVDQGYKEVTLLGQNIDAYGRDMVPKRKFSDLIRTVGSCTDGLQRIRFVTSHPRYMSMGVVDAVADTPQAAKSFHIPFQSGSNSILQAMGRGHSREKYLRIVDRIRTRLPEASITADVIVGFPGETEEDFEDTLSLMREVVFDSVNTAAYSPRPNTPAADWTNQVSNDVKQERLQRINVLNKKHAKQRRAQWLGEEMEILVEERNVKIPTQVMGRTTQGYIVYCEGDIDKLQGEMVQVKITDTQTYYLVGDIVEEAQ